MKKFLFSFVVTAAMLVSFLIPSMNQETVCAEDENIIFSSDFDNGSINDWTPFGGGGKLSLDTSVSHSGENSLKVTDRFASYHGPSLTADTLFTPEKTYEFSAWVYQKSESMKTFQWTLRYVDSLGTSQFMQIAITDAVPEVWTEITGSVTIPEDSISCLIYFECANATTNFYLDDITITGDKSYIEERGVDKKGYLYSYDFENGNELWTPRGDNRLIRTDEHSNTGSHSIYVTNRNHTWNGPTVNINDVKRGVSYFYSAYVMYTGEEYEDSHRFRIEIQYNFNGETIYQLIKEKEVQKNKWTRISGTYTLPEGAADLSFYIQTANVENEEEYTNNDLIPCCMKQVFR